MVWECIRAVSLDVWERQQENSARESAANANGQWHAKRCISIDAQPSTNLHCTTNDANLERVSRYIVNHLIILMVAHIISH